MSAIQLKYIDLSDNSSNNLYFADWDEAVNMAYEMYNFGINYPVYVWNQSDLIGNAQKSFFDNEWRRSIDVSE